MEEFAEEADDSMIKLLKYYRKPNRSFGKEAGERHQKLISQAKKEQAELYQQGIKSEVLREEPFVTAQDELDYKVYLMIYKWQGKNRGVNVRRIN